MPVPLPACLQRRPHRYQVTCSGPNRKAVAEQGLETRFLQANWWSDPTSSSCCTGWHWPGAGKSHQKQGAPYDSLGMEGKGATASALPPPALPFLTTVSCRAITTDTKLMKLAPEPPPG